MRVIKSEVSDSSINAVKVEVVNPTTTTWMRLERSFGDGTPEGSPQTTVNGTATSIYIDSDATSASYGKRKFFTYNLIDGVNANETDASLVNSTEVILPITEATECCWIYIDECTEVGDAVRSGIVKVSYGKLEGTTFTPANNSSYPDVQYIINQRKLFQVTYDDPETTAEENRTYNIEYEEEYLHNFDADDNFGQTEYEGMPWGLDGVHLSYDLRALFFGNANQGWLANLFNGIVNAVAAGTGVNPLYDFYIPKHDTGVSTLATKRGYSGYEFSSEIIQTVNGGQTDSNGDAYDTDTSNDINILKLDEDPKSAIEYCFNKNKRNNKGEVVWQNTDGTYNQSQLNWYLPAIDEIEDIVMGTYGNNQYAYARFIDFQEKFYWSSQPSYIRNFARYEITGQNGEFYYDDTTHARATSVWRNTSENKFDYARSGSTSYFAALRIYATSIWDVLDPSYQILYEGSYQDHTLGTIIREDGNRPRTSKARVRCVRKIDTTTTE